MKYFRFSYQRGSNHNIGDYLHLRLNSISEELAKLDCQLDKIKVIELNSFTEAFNYIDTFLLHNELSPMIFLLNEEGDYAGEKVKSNYVYNLRKKAGLVKKEKRAIVTMEITMDNGDIEYIEKDNPCYLVGSEVAGYRKVVKREYFSTDVIEVEIY